MRNRRKKVFAVFGTRPEAIKIAPVIKALGKAKDRFEVVTCVTAQHRMMLDQMLSVFGIKPDIDLDLMENNQSLASLTSKAVIQLSQVIKSIKPDITLVQGDTTTAMVSGLVSFYEKVPVGHIEAGLRTCDQYNPFPEEINRRIIGSVATYHFAPTQSAVSALLAEGVNSEQIFLIGNTVIDALRMMTSRTNRVNVDLGLRGKRYILLTAHRRENFGQPIRNICQAAKQIVNKNKEIEIVYPVHPNPNIAKPVREILSDEGGIHLIYPLEYQDFVFVMKKAYLILTDSGGIQEEAASLGKPVLVLRKTTERPEAVEAGVARLVGTNTANIVEQTENLLLNKMEYEKMSRASNVFGDGKSAERIVKILTERLFY